MTGDAKVLEALNAQLRDEHAAAIMYGIHAEMFKNWGFPTAAKYARGRQAAEHEHARELEARILLLGGAPAAVASEVAPVIDVRAILDAALASEMKAITGYRATVKVCVDAGDETSADLARHILAEEEEHASDIEADLYRIQAMGMSPFLVVMAQETT